MTGLMRRWEISAFEGGNLNLVKAEIPTPGPGEVLIRVAAVSLNYRDKLFVGGNGYAGVKMPFTPSSDMAGAVVAVGQGVTRFATGDRVVSAFNANWMDGPIPRSGGDVPSLGGSLPGVVADYLAFPESWLAAAPLSLDDIAASTLPCAALTAWTALVELGSLRAGQTVLVQGTGGVSIFAVQFAAALGANVIVTSSDDAKLARAKSLGATHGINRRTTPDWAKSVVEITGGRGAEHVLEMAGGDNLARSLAALAPNGRISLIGIIDGLSSQFPSVPLMQAQGTIQGIYVGHRRSLEEMIRAVDRIGLKPVIDAQYAFADLPAAFEHLERGPFGKIVVRVAA